jgi:hypothetical protein
VTQNSIGEGGVISMPGKKGSRMPFRLGYFWERTTGMLFHHKKTRLKVWTILTGTTWKYITCATFVTTKHDYVFFYMLQWLRDQDKVHITNYKNRTYMCILCILFIQWTCDLKVTSGHLFQVPNYATDFGETAEIVKSLVGINCY